MDAHKEVFMSHNPGIVPDPYIEEAKGRVLALLEEFRVPVSWEPVSGYDAWFVISKICKDGSTQEYQTCLLRYWVSRFAYRYIGKSVSAKMHFSSPGHISVYVGTAVSLDPVFEIVSRAGMGTVPASLSQRKRDEIKRITPLLEDDSLEHRVCLIVREIFFPPLFIEEHVTEGERLFYTLPRLPRDVCVTILAACV